jgi:cyclopropane-fatty-acyl-phospholipid synthase
MLVADIASRIAAHVATPPCGIAIHGLDGSHTLLGNAPPALSVFVRTPRGERALMRLSQLAICEAYIRGDLDFEGDLMEAIRYQTALSDRQFGIKLWRRIKPLLVGRPRCNPAWIEKHYDQKNIQLVAAETRYHTYTPGIYASSDESLEDGAERKLRWAYEALRLEAGRHVLDVGCGWGGFVRYCAARDVDVTGITLSKDQLAFVHEAIAREKLEARVLYQDFFTFTPERKFDGISLMGVMEDLSDYDAVIARLARWLQPGGRVYLDFAASKERVATSSFITEYIWPGRFRMVYMPELVDAVWNSPFDVVAIENDRANYHRWARESYCRWIDRKPLVLERASEELWRTFHIMHAGVANVMRDWSRGVTAYRMVLELPEH